MFGSTPGHVDDLTIETAAVMLPLAHYYDLRELEKICASCIKSGLTTQTVCETYDQIYMLDDPVTDECMRIMQTHTRLLLAHGSLMRMHDAALSKFLAEDRLSIDCELELFDAMLDWAELKCIEDNLLPTSENRRKILKDRLYLIRFAAMTSKEFTLCLSMVGTDFFSDQEISTTMMRIALGNKYKDTAIPPTPPHFGSALRMPYLVEKECHINFGKLVPLVTSRHQWQRQPIMQLAQMHSSALIEQVTVCATNFNEHIIVTGFLIDVPFSTVLSVPDSKRLNYKQTGNRVEFLQPLEIGEDKMFKFTIKYLRRTQLRQVRAHARDHQPEEIFLKVGSWSALKAVLYSSANKSK